MKILKSKIAIAALTTTAALFAMSAHADNSKLQQAYKSNNVQSALVNLCKTEVAKGKKLTDAEVTKVCTCQVKIDGQTTKAQLWEMQSAANQKKNPLELASVKQQHQNLKACFGTALTSKLDKLTQEALAAQKK